MPLISVIMGVYNSNPDMLKKSVESVLNQTCSNLELIICYDDSDKNTIRVLDEICTDERIRLIGARQDRTLAQALNTCIEASGGRYIARQDDDDISAPDRFEKQVKRFEATDADFIGTACILTDIGGEAYGSRRMPDVVKKEDFLFNSPFIHGTVMFKREVFEKHRYRALGKNRTCEDYDLFMRLYADGFKAENIGDRLYYYRYDRKSRKIPFSVRIDEFNVRRKGFKLLGLMPKGLLYCIKPVMLGFVPNISLNRIRKK